MTGASEHSIWETDSKISRGHRIRKRLGAEIALRQTRPDSSTPAVRRGPCFRALLWSGETVADQQQFKFLFVGWRIATGICLFPASQWSNRNSGGMRERGKPCFLARLLLTFGDLLPNCRQPKVRRTRHDMARSELTRGAAMRRQHQAKLAPENATALAQRRFVPRGPATGCLTRSALRASEIFPRSSNWQALYGLGKGCRSC